MSPVTVRRALILFTAGLLAAALAFSGLVRGRLPVALDPPPDAPATANGEALFVRHCAACHSVDDITAFLRAAPDREAGRRALATLLASHGDATPVEAAAIVEYVSTLSR